MAPTLLYVEDDPRAARLMERLVACHRASVRLLLASDAASGLVLARRERPAAVFVDLNLPDMDGLRLIKELRCLDETGDTPIVALSADTAPARKAQSLKAGASAFESKPFDLASVLGLVDAYVVADAGGDAVE